jgi:hypothetical protein
VRASSLPGLHRVDAAGRPAAPVTVSKFEFSNSNVCASFLPGLHRVDAAGRPDAFQGRAAPARRHYHAGATTPERGNNKATAPDMRRATDFSDSKGVWILALKVVWVLLCSVCFFLLCGECVCIRAVPSFELAISQAIYRFLGLMKGIEGQATETAA